MTTMIRFLSIAILCSTGMLFAQWIPSHGPYGGSVSALAFSPNGAGGSNLFAGTYEGVFRSTNNGVTWTSASSGLANMSINCFVGSSNGTGSANLFAGSSGSGVFLSTNEGSSWTSASIGMPTYSIINTLLQYPALGGSGTHLLAGTRQGVFRSTNNGSTWSSVSKGIPEYISINALAISPLSNGSDTMFVAGTDYGVFMSTNLGFDWTPSNTGLTVTDIQCLAAEDTLLFAGTRNGVFRSTNSGFTWTSVSSGLPTDTYVHSLIISSNGAGGSNIFVGTFNGVFLSTNLGTTWTTINMGLPIKVILSLCVVGPNLYAGTDGLGIFLSTDSGMSWKHQSNGLSNLPIMTLAAIPMDAGDSKLLAGTFHYPDGTAMGPGFWGCGMFASDSKGLEWTNSTGISEGEAVMDFASITNKSGGTIIFAVTAGGGRWQHGGIYQSSDTGRTWTSLQSNLPEWIDLFALAITPGKEGDRNLFAGGDYGVFLSTNIGTSWTKLDSGLHNADVYAFATTPNGAGGINHFAGGYPGVFLSTNSGTSWTAASTGLTRSVDWLAVNPNGSGGMNLFAGGAGVFLSTNNGTSWTEITNGLPKHPEDTTSYDVGAFAVSGSNLFAGTDHGVFLSTNNGTIWTAVNTGISNTRVNALLISGSNIFAGTETGLWQRPLSEITEIQRESENQPLTIVMMQNYPNPFNPSTTITYTIPERSNVRLSIFNTLGQKISEILNETKDAGSYELSFIASELSSGIYFYRIEATSVSNSKTFVETKKMVLIR